MNKYIGITLMTSALLLQMQLQVRAQSTDQVESQMPQLHPPISGTLDTNRSGQAAGHTTTQSSSPLPFTTSSPYSYSEPASTANGSSESQPAVTTPLPVTNSGNAAAMPSKSTKQKQKQHGFSPAGAVFGVPDRAVKSSLGLTDRTAKAGLGVTGKTTKEFFKAIF